MGEAGVKKGAKGQTAMKPLSASSAKTRFWITQLQLKCHPEEEGWLGQQGPPVTA